MKRQLIQQGRFATTQWHVVKQATEAPDLERLEALDTLLRRYGPAMIEYIRRRFRFTETEAEDMAQQFVADRVMVKNALANACQTRGKFRTFLLLSIQHFVCDQLRKQQSQKRCPPNGFVSLDETNLESTLVDEEQQLFDEGFARQVIAEAMHRTHERCVAKDQLAIWEILYSRILEPHLEDIQPEPYDRLVADLGLKNRADAQNKLASGKRIFQRSFREVVEEFSDSAEDFEEEWRYFARFFDTK